MQIVKLLLLLALLCLLPSESIAQKSGPRIDGLAVGDGVRFNGEYVWNDKGGMIHWTHHDPQRRHVAGWVVHNGRTYQ